MNPIPFFVGYDKREAVGYHVFCHSVLARTKLDVSFTPMRGSGSKPMGSSTAFDHTRWDVPRLCGYSGLAIWAECDMLCRTDIAELLECFNNKYDVMVAKHDYRTRFPVKFLGQSNEDYPRKNWSSLMVINCRAAVWQRIDYLRLHNLPDLRLLHSFPERIESVALFDQDRIGALDLGWNWLVGEYPHNPKAAFAHFTIGLPCFKEYKDCDYSNEWRAELAALGACG